MAWTYIENDHDADAERMARGYLALAAGHAGKALRLLAADRLDEINARAHLRRVAVNQKLRDEGRRHG